MEKLVANGKLFDGCNKKLSSLKKNHLFLIITSIIGYIKNNVQENVILASFEKCLIYHFFVHEINDKEKRETFKLNDGILRRLFRKIPNKFPPKPVLKLLRKNH